MRLNIFTVGGVILNKGFILLLRMVKLLYFLILCVRHSWEQMMFIDAVFANLDGNTITIQCLPPVVIIYFTTGSQ